MKVEMSSQYISQGVQGRIYVVERINGTGVHDILAKRYHDSSHANIQKKFIKYLGETRVTLHPELECVPYEYFKQGKQYGVIMKKALGKPLECSYNELAHTELRHRLGICGHISRGISHLHSAGIVHADICDANIIYNGIDVRIIDVDGGGIPSKGIEPSVRGHSGGSILAPELYFDNTKLPNFLSDIWSLAVLIHKIIVYGLDPFYFIDKYSDIKKTYEWPLRKGTSKIMEIINIQLPLLDACRPVFMLLNKTFNVGIRSPGMRTNAKEFEEVIRQCLLAFYQCPQCHKEFVTNDTNKCPFCDKIFSDVVLTLKNKEYALNQRKLFLTSEDFGYKDSKPLIMFQSNDHKVYCQMFDGLRIRYKGREIATKQLFIIPVDSPRILEICYNGSKLQVVVYNRNS